MSTSVKRQEARIKEALATANASLLKNTAVTNAGFDPHGFIITARLKRGPDGKQARLSPKTTTEIGRRCGHPSEGSGNTIFSTSSVRWRLTDGICWTMQTDRNLEMRYVQDLKRSVNRAKGVAVALALQVGDEEFRIGMPIASPSYPDRMKTLVGDGQLSPPGRSNWICPKHKDNKNDAYSTRDDDRTTKVWFNQGVGNQRFIVKNSQGRVIELTLKPGEILIAFDGILVRNEHQVLACCEEMALRTLLVCKRTRR